MLGGDFGDGADPIYPPGTGIGSAGGSALFGATGGVRFSVVEAGGGGLEVLW
jgi:hypothetical protein